MTSCVKYSNNLIQLCKDFDKYYNIPDYYNIPIINIPDFFKLDKQFDRLKHKKRFACGDLKEMLGIKQHSMKLM